MKANAEKFSNDMEAGNNDMQLKIIFYLVTNIPAGVEREKE